MIVGGITGYMGFLDFLGLSRAPLLHVAVDEGRGPAVVLLHGIASSSVTFDNVVPLIREHHRVIAIDLLGFGQSPKPVTSNYTLEEHVAALKRTIRSLEYSAAAPLLVGHSSRGIDLSAIRSAKPQRSLAPGLGGTPGLSAGRYRAGPHRALADGRLSQAL